MDVRAGDLKIGAVLGIGKYAPVGSNKMPSTVLWLKASDDCTLVAKHVLDYLIFDGREKIGVSNGWNEFIGNPDYYLSNLQQYLNSDALDWFMPMHDHDTPPDRSHSPCGGEYDGVPGFLHLFQPHEKASFVSGVRLLRINDLAAGSDSRFPLFKKKGIRATATDDLKEVRPMRVPAGTYVSYWMMDRRGSDGPNSALTLGKSGWFEQNVAYYASGVRPVVQIDSDVIVDATDSGFYMIRPFAADDHPEHIENNKEENILDFFGWA